MWIILEHYDCFVLKKKDILLKTVMHDVHQLSFISK